MLSTRPFLTYNELASLSRCAILTRMNGFRITILALLAVTVGLMVYVVFVTLPGMQADRHIYDISRRSEQNDRQTAGHRERVGAYEEGTDDPELAGAYSDAAEADRQAEEEVYEAEEQAVIEEAKRKAAAARAAEEKAAADAQRTDGAIGLVTSFNKEWVSIMFKPAIDDVLNDGLVVAVRRQGVVLCEATIDYRDDESGQIGATLRPQEFGKTQVDVDSQTLLPSPGDEVIFSPFASARELRRDNTFLTPQPLSVPASEDSAAAPVEPIPQP